MAFEPEAMKKLQDQAMAAFRKVRGLDASKDNDFEIISNESMRGMFDNLATVESIYDVAGLSMTADARRQIETHMVNHPRGKHGQVAYDLRADFGVEPAAVRERFQPYLEAFPGW